jgi:hypothetical protein
MILLSLTAYIKQVRKTGQAWNFSQMEGKLTDMENYQPGHIVKNGEEEITVEEITQALAKGTGEEEVGVDRRTQGPVH